MNVVSSNPAPGEVYSIQHYVIKCVSDLRQVGGFLRVLRFHPSIKLTTTISEILLKVALNTITLLPPPFYTVRVLNVVLTELFTVADCIQGTCN